MYIKWQDENLKSSSKMIHNFDPFFFQLVDILQEALSHPEHTKAGV